MWQQSYTPILGSVAWSALAAAIPIFVLLYLLAVRRTPSWKAALFGLGAAALVALVVYRMPAPQLVSAAAYGVAFGLFPIGWIVFWPLVLYRLSVETGHFDIIKDSVGSITQDKRLQALLVAFCFGAFLEGAAGFGSPVAVTAGMLTGLGFSPFYAAGVCLLANTAPVAFGSLGIPLLTLNGITGLPLLELSAGVGKICAPLSLFIPSYLLGVVGGWRALRGVLPASLLCGASFAGTQYFVSTYIGPQLTDVMSSLVSLVVLVLFLRVWQPKDNYQLPGTAPAQPVRQHAPKVMLLAWSPYLLLVLCMLVWVTPAVRAMMDQATLSLPWPALHQQIQRMPPVVTAAAPYAALFKLDWMATAGTACAVAAVLSSLVLGVSPARFVRLLGATLLQLRLPLLTIVSMLSLAFLLNYCGATATLGLAFATTGSAFPFFSALLGWLGVFLTGSDTSANALFGNLQVVTANRLGLDPILMASSNSSGGVVGKMISLQSIAVAVAATGMAVADESRLFRFTIRHSTFLAVLIGLLVLFYAYVPGA